MLRIGEFSKLTGVSIHMLRHYDKIGLLVPAHIEGQTGYRYYSEAQIMLANRIQVLKRLGFGLKEIINVQSELWSYEGIKLVLEDKIEEKIEEREMLNKQIKEIRKALYEIEEEEVCLALEVNIKTFPARIVASVRGILHDFPEEGRLWESLFKACMKHNIHLADSSYTFAITHSLDLKQSIMDVEVQCMVEKLYKDVEELKFLKVSECLVATVAFRGQYTQIGKINAYMGKWIKENGYEMKGLPFTTYYRSPGNEQNPEQFITELCFPIEKVVV